VLFLNDGEALLCLDGKTGEPQGFVELPKATLGGTQRRKYGVVPSGGLVVQRVTMRGARYEWVNCF
jgi:hypothetical protein